MKIRISIDKGCPHCEGLGKVREGKVLVKCHKCFGFGWFKSYMNLDEFKQLIKSILEEMI